MHTQVTSAERVNEKFKCGCNNVLPYIQSTIQYIPQNMHMVVLCFVLLWFHCLFLVDMYNILPISFRITSLALGQLYDCPSASEVILKDMGKIDLHINGIIPLNNPKYLDKNDALKGSITQIADHVYFSWEYKLYFCVYIFVTWAVIGIW